MKKDTSPRTSVAAAVAAAGLAVGGIGIASAASSGQGNDTTPAVFDTSAATEDGKAFGPGMRGKHGKRGGFGMHRGPGDLSELADAMDVSEDELTSAFEATREELRPDADGFRDRSGPPSEADREQRQEQLASALAEELGISAADVTSAFEEVHEAEREQRRAAFEERLDEAVSAGDLTDADRTSVLKAYDAGLLHGGR